LGGGRLEHLTSYRFRPATQILGDIFWNLVVMLHVRMVERNMSKRCEHGIQVSKLRYLI